MALHFKTDKPQKLLNTFKKAIDDGHVKTWSYDKDGDFTHATEQWKDKAWLRPRVISGRSLTLNILGPKNQKISSEVYAIYHGRFIEAMLRHCDELFSSGTASALPEDGDSI